AAGQDAMAMVCAFPPRTVIYLADAAAIKEVTSSRAKFPKPVELYKILMVFGGNIVASEGEEWKRYRTIAAPAFSEVQILGWYGTKRSGSCSTCSTMYGETSPKLCIALFVIGVAGFGRRVTWTSDLTVPAGHQMTFKDALHISSTSLILKLILPSWTMKLTERTRKADLAINELNQYMVEMVNTRRNAETKEERYDLFSGLLDAAEGDLDGAAAITEEELIGKCYLSYDITTAHTLCFTFAMLALYPDEQERLHQQIKGIMADLDGMPPTMVMQSQAPSVPKRAAEDTMLTVNNADGGKTTFPVPTGTELQLHVPALHYNPTYWKDPYTFRPQRFLEDYPKEAFLPFSAGARACLGRRFFETEGIAIITMMMLKYRVEVKQDPEFAGETLEQCFARITSSEQYLSNTPDRVPLVFKRR
ncbi:Cytochrome P450, partial [Lactarius tabidus]